MAVFSDNLKGVVCKILLYGGIPVTLEFFFKILTVEIVWILVENSMEIQF